MFTALLKQPQPRVELAAALQLNQGTITRITQRLIERGLVIEEDAIPGGRGRPSRLLRIDPTSRLTIGVHVGTEIVGTGAVALDGATLCRETEPHDGTLKGIGRTVQAQVEGVRDWLVDEGLARRRWLGIGIATSGWSDTRAGCVRPHKLPGSLFKQLTDQLSNLDVPVTLTTNASAHAAAHLLFDRDSIGDFLHLYVGNVCEVARAAERKLFSPRAFMVGSVERLGLLTHQGWASFPEALTDLGLRARAGALGKDAPIEELIERARSGDAELARLLEQRALDTGRACEALAELTGVGRVVVSGSPTSVPEHIPLIVEGARSAATAEPCEVVPIVGLREHLIPAAAAPVIAAFSEDPIASDPG